MYQDMFITVSGSQYYYQQRPFRVGSYLSLKKEPDNAYDMEAIVIETPVLGKVGYVANSVYTVAQGTMSAGRIYDAVPRECAAVVRFIINGKIIAQVIPDKKINVHVEVSVEPVAI